jgi:hypothetical protein
MKSRKRKAVYTYPTCRQPASRSTYEFGSTHSELPNPQKASHNDLIKSASNPIESHPSQSQTNPITHSASLLPHPYYPARWPDPFSPHPTTTPLVQHFCQPLSPAQSVRTFRPERSIHSEPLKVSLSSFTVFPSSPAFSTTPPHSQHHPCKTQLTRIVRPQAANQRDAERAIVREGATCVK